MKKALKILVTVILAIIVATPLIWQGEIRTIVDMDTVSDNNPKPDIFRQSPGLDIRSWQETNSFNGPNWTLPYGST